MDYLSPLKQQRIRQKVEKTGSSESPGLRIRINVSESLRIIFAGTPDFAARHLDALLSLVITSLACLPSQTDRQDAVKN